MDSSFTAFFVTLGVLDGKAVPDRSVEPPFTALVVDGVVEPSTAGASEGFFGIYLDVQAALTRS